MKNQILIFFLLISVGALGQTKPRATQVKNTPAATVSATNVQSAIDEVAAEADAKVADIINDGVTTIAPSQNAVYDQFALLQNSVDQINKVLVTGAVTLTSSAYGKVHDISGTSADYTIVLPTAVGNEGKTILFKCDPDVSIMSIVATIDGSGTEKIDNYLTYKLACGGRLGVVARVISGVGSWEVINFDQGAYIQETLSWTPFTVQPTYTSRWKLLHSGLLHIVLRALTDGTATSATTMQFTLPNGFIPAFIQRHIGGQYVNNNAGSTTPGMISANSTSTGVIDCYTSVGSGGWSGANGRSLNGSFMIAVQ